MRFTTILWAFLTPLIFYFSVQLSQIVDKPYWKTVVGCYGILFVLTAWLFGKGSGALATDIGMKGGEALRRRAQKAKPAAAKATMSEPVYPAPPPVRREPLERKRTLALVRKPRCESDVSKMGTSWLGGLPSLGSIAWPSDSTGAPMHHLVQIDLSDAGPKAGVKGLPSKGSLAFFASLGEWPFETEVRFVETPGTPTPAPAHLGPIQDHCMGGPYSKGELPENLTTFPRWALDLIAFDAPDNPEMLEGVISEHLPQASQYNLGGGEICENLPNGLEPSWWDSAQRFARSFASAMATADERIAARREKLAQDEARLLQFERDGAPSSVNLEQMRKLLDRERSQLQRMDEARPRMEALAVRLLDWAGSRDAWTVMTRTDIDRFKREFERFSYAAKDSDEQLFYKYNGNDFHSLGDITTETLKAMVRGPENVYRKLPQAIRDEVDRSFLRPAGGRMHQMFGLPANVQTAAEDNEDKHLLLQLAFDDLMGMRWGDGGYIQFWIRPEDLSAQRWDKVTSTVESH